MKVWKYTFPRDVVFLVKPDDVACLPDDWRDTFRRISPKGTIFEVEEPVIQEQLKNRGWSVVTIKVTHASVGPNGR